MRNRDFQRIMSVLADLTPTQLRAAERRLNELNAARSTLTLVDSRLEQLKGCPRCGHPEFQRWGHTRAAVQRYRCRGCGSTFTSLTGAPFSHIHDKAKLLANAACMRDFLSVRKAAKQLGVHRNTAFHYRHLMMPELARHQPDSLEGVTEADEMFFRRSYKGQKSKLPRKAHKRGSPAKKRGISREQVPVLTAVARGSKQSLVQVLDGPPSSKELAAILAPVLKKDAVLCTDSAGTYAAVGKELGVLVRQIPSGSHKLGPYHIQNANALHSRFKGRMRVFRGVATKYLPAYLAWVRFFDRPRKDEGAQELLLDAIGVPLPEAA